MDNNDNTVFVIEVTDSVGKVLCLLRSNKKFLSTKSYFTVFIDCNDFMTGGKIPLRVPGVETKEPWNQYFKMWKWMYEGSNGNPPIDTFHPHTETIAYFLEDVEFLSGNYYKQFSISFGAIERKDILVSDGQFMKLVEIVNSNVVEIQSGYYSQIQLIEKLTNAVKLRNINAICHVREITETSTLFIYFEGTDDLEIYPMENCPFTFSNIYCLKAYLPKRVHVFSYDLNHTLMDIPPESLYVMCQQYTNEINDLNECGFRKLATFTKKCPALATLIWKDNAEIICNTFGIPKSTQSKILKFESDNFNDLFELTDRYAKLQEPTYVFEDVELARISKRIDSLRNELKNTAKPRIRKTNFSHIHRLLIGKSFKTYNNDQVFNDITGQPLYEEIMNKIDGAEADWWARYQKLEKNRKEQEKKSKVTISNSSKTAWFQVESKIHDLV